MSHTTFQTTLYSLEGDICLITLDKTAHQISPIFLDGIIAEVYMPETFMIEMFRL